MSSSEYTPLSRTTRLVAAATSVVLTSSIFVAVAVGLTGSDATGLWAAAVPAAGAVPQPA
jgi:hypothetical protein